jgi:hypothetical protein
MSAVLIVTVNGNEPEDCVLSEFEFDPMTTKANDCPYLMEAVPAEETTGGPDNSGRQVT